MPDIFTKSDINVCNNKFMIYIYLHIFARVYEIVVIFWNSNLYDDNITN